MKGFEFTDCGSIDYGIALDMQTKAFDTIVESKQKGDEGKVDNHLFFCEHQPVLTLGKSGRQDNLLVANDYLDRHNIALYRTGRGGDITYHGPGQITAYPVFDLDFWKIGLRRYIGILEDIVIDFLALYGLKGERIEGAAGVWICDGGGVRKICAIGVRSSRFVTMHGLALNINTDLYGFSLINPCGFTDRGVTSLAVELGGVQDFGLAKDRLLELFTSYFPASAQD